MPIIRKHDVHLLPVKDVSTTMPCMDKLNSCEKVRRIPHKGSKPKTITENLGAFKNIPWVPDGTWPILDLGWKLPVSKRPKLTASARYLYPTRGYLFCSQHLL